MTAKNVRECRCLMGEPCGGTGFEDGDLDELELPREEASGVKLRVRIHTGQNMQPSVFFEKPPEPAKPMKKRSEVKKPAPSWDDVDDGIHTGDFDEDAGPF